MGRRGIALETKASIYTSFFKVQDPIPLTLYENGIIMFNGPFRSYDDLTTQRCLGDIMDGYFPSELQKRYPEGVPIKVTDDGYALKQGHQHGARGDQVARTDHVDRPRACSGNSTNMISVFTLTNISNFY